MKSFKQTLKKFRWQRASIIALSMGVLSTMSFNCAPSLFQGADYSYLNAGSVAFSGEDMYANPKDSPWVLQNTHQIYSSMANVTGQAGRVSASQLAEYDVRTGALSQTDRLTDINAPMQMAASSLAGEFCNGLINTETAPAPGVTRKYFVAVNFNANLAGNTTQAYSDAINAMAKGFWGRELKAEEASILQSYYNDFVSTAGTQTAQTRNLYLSTCAGMLASFDAITY